MLRVTCWFCFVLACSNLLAGERVIDFGQYPTGQTPPGFRSMLSGGGKPGDWRVIEDKGDSGAAQSGSTNPPVKVLAQLSQDGTDERFPLLVFEESYGDFVVKTRIKMVDGLFEQMAGLAFRIQDTNNYYYVRASSLGNTFRFIKLVNGQRLTTVGPSLEISRGVWHDLEVECKGNKITCRLDGKDVIPPLTDNTFNSGRIGFWTKSDSVSYFGQTKIVYTPHETLAEVLVREAMGRYPRLAGLKLYHLQAGDSAPKIVASTYADEVGLTGGKTEADVIARGSTYFGRQKGYCLVTLPLHDRNGEVVAAVRVVLEAFPGQTEQNAIARAQPIVKQMELRIRTAKDLLQ